MTTGLEDLGLTEDEIRAACAAEIHAGKVELARDAAAFWVSVSPSETGDYRDSITVIDDGQQVSVTATDEAANIIEYGSEDTEEFGPRAKTENRFRGG